MNTTILPERRKRVKPLPSPAPEKLAGFRMDWLDQAGRYRLAPHKPDEHFRIIKLYGDDWQELPVSSQVARFSDGRYCTCEARHHPDCRHRQFVRFFLQFLACPSCGTPENPAISWATSFHYDFSQPDLRIDSSFDVLDMVCLACECRRRASGGSWSVPRTSHWRESAWFTRAEAQAIGRVIESYRRRDPFYLPGRRS